MRLESQAIINDVKAYIDRHSEVGEDSTASEQEFGELALKIFNFQCEYNAAYRNYAKLKRKLPHQLASWRDIPPMPIQAFKRSPLSCEPPEHAAAVFMTSGTTHPEQRGRQYHPTFEVWDASMRTGFRPFVMGEVAKLRVFSLSPAEDIYTDSSLSRYLSQAIRLFGTSGSESYFRHDGLAVEQLLADLRACEEEAEPVLLLGATFAYVPLLDTMEKLGIRFRLAPGSRILDTGGFKGKSREVSMDWLYEKLAQCFGVPRSLCVNMYGMTELCSQYYDTTILTGVSTSMKRGPAWLRPLVLDPTTLLPAAEGTVGVLAHFDLANWNSCVAILTEDIGVMRGGSFELMGRIAGSEARGCSLAVEQFIQSNGLATS
ncbi:LuxE/PaaK family acyltransferase [Paenibacillus aestuarii]|uniref:CoF synthetase n=1 Tax=Paenibacillus aestuarii TaxID=516965 RepID=A0ABW0K3G6_9BACL|nr:CoF synthetase [Paenibacillus aestuarii]